MDKITQTMLISLITNLFLAITKILAGFLGASGALIADGVHSLSDMITDIVAAVGNIISKKPADYEHPFGHGNTEYLTCLVIGLIIAFIGIKVIYEGITKQATTPNLYTSIICLITILLKLILSQYVLKKGKIYNNNILISSGKESFTDVISSIIVFISILLSRLSETNNIFKYSDKLAMTFVGIMIIKISTEIFKENISNLLGKRMEDKEYINYIKKIIKAHKEIIKIDSLIIVKFGMYKKIDCEVSMNQNMKLLDVHSIVDTIEKEIQKDRTVSNIIMHVNPYTKSR